MAKITYTDKTVGSKFKADDANEIKESVNDIYDNGVPDQKPSLTGFKYQVSSISETDNNYTAWPYGCLFYDESIDRVIQVYSAKNAHIGTTGVVYIRKLDYKNELDWSSRVVVADRTAEGLVATSHAAGMDANGDYLCIVRFTDSVGDIISTYLYRSTDQGATWSGSQWLENGVSPINPAEAGSIFKTQTGTLLTYYRGSSNNYVTRSADNGLTWINKLVANPIGDTPLEGGFVQVPDGTIVCIVRASIGGEPYSSKVSALYTKSTDDGETWSPLALTNIEDMTANPAALLYHSETNTIEIVYGSRFLQSDGYSSIWQATTSIENLKLGIFNPPVRIALGSGTKDFGYPAMCQTADGHVVVGYYNGLSTKTSINYLIGRRSESPEGVSDGNINLLRNPATFEPHADFTTAIDVSTKRPLMALRYLKSLSFTASAPLTADLIATANGQTLTGLDVTPTYTDGAFTGVTHVAIRGNSGSIRSTLSTGGSVEITGIGSTSGAINTNSGGGLLFQSGGTTGMQLMGTTRNVVMQNGGTFSDSGEGLQVNKNARFTATQSASGGLAKGVLINPALTATANNDLLAALDIQPTFTNGVFTGVANLSIRTNGAIRSTVSTGGSIEMVGVGLSTGAINVVSGGGLLFQTNGTTGMEVMPTSRRVIIQDGGTFTDDNINRLQVAGSVKATQYNLSALNTAPASATATGTLGEIRWTATHVYLCTATNTWVRAALATW